ncbi:MAG TPA: dihydroorotate dehydrogenase electron transfer subunit [Lentisphaeria bacterium]|nr:MAG: hypothetical protein A2X47_11235 [Lentisphaerae bacterium GWF2_38_69]HBM16353.1 dihydroorotate dehydrogenase electron transfer subunit [Lentisphaeria bacterium]
MFTEKAEILSNKNLKGDYYQVDFYSPKIAENARAGQFAHVQIGNMEAHILRRPFSIFDTRKDGTLSIVYKAVGHGTKVLSEMKYRDICDILGPQGNAYTPATENIYPVIVVGGYGAAAAYMLAKEAKIKGKLLIGARTKEDLILIDNYKELGFEVEIATEDGSMGRKGLVTELLSPYLNRKNSMIYACGPNGMMYAVAKLARANDSICEVSLDHPMCCGVGACFACVVKVYDKKKESWVYARSCKEGPVFNSKDIFIE